MIRCAICNGTGWISVKQGLYDASKRCACNPGVKHYATGHKAKAKKQAPADGKAAASQQERLEDWEVM